MAAFNRIDVGTYSKSITVKTREGSMKDMFSIHTAHSLQTIYELRDSDYKPDRELSRSRRLLIVCPQGVVPATRALFNKLYGN